MDSKKINLIMLLVGLILLIYLLSGLDYNYLKNFDFSLTFFNILILILIIFSIFLIRTQRWRLYLDSIGIKLSFKDAYFISVPSMGLALFTPAQSGDLLKIELLKNKKKTLRRDSIATIFIEKLMDFALIFFIFLISIIYYSLSIFNLNYYFLFGVFLLGIFLAPFVFYFLYKKFKFVKVIINNTKKILSNPKTVIYTLLLTLIYWFIVCLNWMFVARVTNIEISFFQMFGVLSIGTILGIISFIPGALGVMEYSTVLLLSTFLGIPETQAIVFALSYRLYTVVMYVIIYLHLLIKRD